LTKSNSNHIRESFFWIIGPINWFTKLNNSN
jgi:hypothetical protein